MTRSIQITTGLLAMGLLACGSDGTLPMEETGAGSPSFSAAPSRSMSGTCSSTYVISDPVFLPPPDDDIVVSFVATHEGTCQLAHLGRTTMRTTELVTFDDNGIHIQGAPVVLIAANGDELHASENDALSGFREDGTFSFTGTWTFTGGTGRFAGAGGSLEVAGTGNTITNSAYRSVLGWISY